jgi:methionyl-tRNA formyltransferase
VLLAGPGDSTEVVANYLASRVSDLVLVIEDSQSRLAMTRRRARRLGWVTATGQVLFIVLVQPLLRRRSRRRRSAIVDSLAMKTAHPLRSHKVSSVNDDETVTLLRSFQPDVIVVHGTRIIAASVLASAGCPVINMHAGITPRYRGVHGGYWALVEHHPEWVGTTVHLVDPGIDTGGILAQTTFAVSDDDSIATYPDLHLTHGLPLLADQIGKIVAGRRPEPLSAGLAPGSGLYYHPTIWEYLWHRWRHGVR